MDIEEKVKLAKETEIKISGAREVYRPVATRGSLMYFLIDNINTLDRVYHYSMANFVFILRKGMDVTPGGPDESKVAPAKRLEEEVCEHWRSQISAHAIQAKRCNTLLISSMHVYIDLFKSS